MARALLISFTFVLLSACQLQQSDGPQTTREQRLAISSQQILDCDASRCGLLNLDSMLVDDYTQIADMTHVTALMASFSDFDDLADIAPMGQLTELHVGQTLMTDLGGLSRFPNLTLLHVQDNNSVESFAPIGQLSKLEELAIGGNNLGDMDFLRDLSRLRSLSIVNARFTSLEALRGHPNLVELDLDENRVPDDISALLTIPNLERLTIELASLNQEQRAVVDQLEAKGVAIDVGLVMVVC